MAPSKGPAINTEDERSERSIVARFVKDIPFNIGSRDRRCIHCGALRWSLERTAQNQKVDRDVFSNCCQQGDVTLPMSDFDGPLVPDEMKELFMGTTPSKYTFIIVASQTSSSSP